MVSKKFVPLSISLSHKDVKEFTDLLTTLAASPWYTPAGSVISLDGMAFNLSDALIGGRGNDNLFDLGGKAVMLGGQGRDTFTIVGTKTGAVSNTFLDLGRGDDLVINFQENMTARDYAQAVKAYEKAFAGKSRGTVLLLLHRRDQVHRQPLWRNDHRILG